MGIMRKDVGTKCVLCILRAEIVFREAQENFPQTTSYRVHSVLLTGFTAPLASPERETPACVLRDPVVLSLFHQCYVTEIKYISLIWGKKPH